MDALFYIETMIHSHYCQRESDSVIVREFINRRKIIQGHSYTSIYIEKKKVENMMNSLIREERD